MCSLFIRGPHLHDIQPILVVFDDHMFVPIDYIGFITVKDYTVSATQQLGAREEITLKIGYTHYVAES